MIPHMLKLAKKQSFPEDFPKPRKFRETSRNDWIFKFRVQNQVSWQKVSGKNTQYIEISQNQPNLGHFVVLGFWDSKVQKIKEVTKSTQNYPIYVTGIISAKNYQKTTLFAIVAILLCKSSNKKRQCWCYEFFWLKNCVWPKGKVLSQKKFLKSKLCPFLDSTQFWRCSTPSGGFKKKATTEFSILFSWFHQFWSQILKISSFVLGTAF